MAKVREMKEILFILRDKELPEEVRRACEGLREEGIRCAAQPAAAFIENAQAAPSKREALYLTNDEAALAYLQKERLPVCGYAAQKEPLPPAFSKAPYLVTEPDEVGVADYEKIHARLTGRPWTILETPRTLVRETVEEDADGLYACYDEEALRYLEPLPEREAQLAAMRSYRETVYAFYGFGRWSILEKETGAFVGYAGYEPYVKGEEAVSFGYLIHPAFRRQGYAEEVCRALLRYGADELGFRRIRAVTHADNAASVGLLRKLGFVRTQGIEKTEAGGSSERPLEEYCLTALQRV